MKRERGGSFQATRLQTLFVRRQHRTHQQGGDCRCTRKKQKNGAYLLSYQVCMYVVHVELSMDQQGILEIENVTDNKGMFKEGPCSNSVFSQTLTSAPSAKNRRSSLESAHCKLVPSGSMGPALSHHNIIRLYLPKLGRVPPATQLIPSNSSRTRHAEIDASF